MTSFEYALRRATKDDYEYCYRLTKFNMYWLFCRHWGGWKPSIFKKAFNAKNVNMVIIEGKRAGYLCLKTDSEFIYIENIQLSPYWQGKGLGTSLLNHLINKYPEKRFCLTTFDDNPAKRLYERMGFAIIERSGMTIKMERPA